MKRPVSLIASLGLAVSLTAACGGVEAGKTELTDICLKRYGNSQAKCDCYVGALETKLTPELFATLAKGAYDHRDYAGKDWLPNSVRDQPEISAGLREATESCLK